ncbi:MAG: hypothetical protein AAF621_02450 [Pseudomonadota bacterium]
MNDILQYHPLDDVFTPGLYVPKKDALPAYTIRAIRDLSVVEIIPFGVCHQEVIECLKTALGLIAPASNSAYIAGTRTILSPSGQGYIVTTEGEARQVLSRRLEHALRDYAGIYEESAAYAVLRIDGFHFYAILSELIDSPALLDTTLNFTTYLTIDDHKIILHRKSDDVHFLYLPRSVAPEIYIRIARSCLKAGVRLI